MTDTERDTPEVDERLPDGLRYTEAVDRSGRWISRQCALRIDGEQEPVSSLVLHSLRVRFGETALRAEGVGGVQTRPGHRRRGYNARLIRRAMLGARDRVPAMFLYGIEGYYTQFGFAACLPESSMSMWVRRTRTMKIPDGWSVRAARDEELPTVNALFNELHAKRPWSCIRDLASVRHLKDETAWKPRPDVVLCEHDGAVAGYAAIAHRPYGWNERTFNVFEAGARTTTAARVILADIARRCREDDLERYTVEEPADSLVGIVARSLGCAVTETTSSDGGGMGILLDRQAAVHELSDELRRRVRASVPTTAGDGSVVERALAMLADRTLVSDDGALLRLLVGYRSWDEAVTLGECDTGGPEAAAADAACRLLFPGGGPVLPAPYAHRLDRY